MSVTAEDLISEPADPFAENLTLALFEILDPLSTIFEFAMRFIFDFEMIFISPFDSIFKFLPLIISTPSFEIFIFCYHNLFSL